MAFDGTLKFDTAIDQSGFKIGISNLGSIAKTGMAAVTTAVTAATGAMHLEYQHLTQVEICARSMQLFQILTPHWQE